VIADLVDFGLVRVVATFQPLVTFKKGMAHRPAPRRERSKREDRR
jgi:release factor H-coupled RctB family protein